MPDETNAGHWEDFKKPINIVSIGLGVISLLIGVAFYVLSLRSKEITYLIGEPSKIFATGVNDSELKLFSKSGEEIKQDVYTADVTLWNSGDFPIPSEDARQPLCFGIEDGGRILDFGVIRATRQSIAKFRLYEAPPDNDSGKRKLCIRWTFFDPNFGIRARLVHTSKTQSSLALTGYVVGIPEFFDGAKLTVDRYIPYNSPFRFLLIFGPLIILAPIIIVLFNAQFLQRHIWLLFSIFVVMMFSTTFWWVQFISRTPTPPI